MLNRQTALTRAQSARLENPQSKAKLVQASKPVEQPTTRRAALKDVTNLNTTTTTGAVGRAKKLTKMPTSQSIKVPVATTKAVSHKVNNKRPAESDPMELSDVHMPVEHVHKKRKSEPSEDRMQLDEVAIPKEARYTDDRDTSGDEDQMDTEPLEPWANIPHDDIDLYEADDPQAVAAYAEDIHNHMRKLEVSHPDSVIVTSLLSPQPPFWHPDTLRSRTWSIRATWHIRSILTSE